MNECQISFFLEKDKNSYIITHSNCNKREQEKAEITFRALVKKETLKIEKFQVNWEKVRFFIVKII